jgi:CRP-like cAMP-binding protein
MSVAERPGEDLEVAMAATPILASTAMPAIRALAGHGTVRMYRRGTYLFHQGDDAGDVFFLHAGRIEISSFSTAGTRVLHTTLEPPQFFGELGVLGEMLRSTTAEALEDSLVWAVRGEHFMNFLDEQPHAARGLLRALSRQIAAHESLVDDLLFLDLRGRVAKRLLGLVSSLDDVPDDGTLVPSVITHADLASLAGGSRESVTRVLSEFQRRGILGRNGRRYVLKDVKTLRKLAHL